jgi:amino acid adenylation domain-containing protein
MNQPFHEVESTTSSSKQLLTLQNSLTEVEKHQILFEWNKTQTDYPEDKCLHQLFEEQVEWTPDAIAVVFEDQQLTYQELNAKANQLAHYLQALGVRSEALVGICVERSLEMVISILGILKAGGAYVPLDPTYPQERLTFMLEDAAVPVLLTQSHLAKRLSAHLSQIVCLDKDQKDIDQQSQDNVIQNVKAQNLAYVIYTSGSTGKPKGILVEHRGVVNLVHWHQQTFAVSSLDRTTQLSGFAFDASVWEIWSCLTVGASLYIANDEIRLSPVQLQAWLISNNITVSFLPTPLAEHILALDWSKGVNLRVLLTGGDKLQCHPASSIPFKVVNNYGPSENTVVTTSGIISASNQADVAPSIGKTIANTQLYILDRNLQPVPIGISGELHIGGDGLARGYLNRPDLTQEKFIPNPFSHEPGSRLYKTGDLARYLPDGNIEFLGRIDHQVKIRGFRIELGEIEAALTKHPDVQQPVVVVRENVLGDKQLVAYYVTQQTIVASRELREFLQQHLPEHMIPNAFVKLDALPLTPNGKVDRHALPVPEKVRSGLNNSFVALSPIETALAAIWAEVLKLDQVGIYDEFLELGGHSLLAAQIINRVTATLKIELSIANLFTASTIVELAKQIEANRQDQSLLAPSIQIVAKDQLLPLSYAQERLWFLSQLEPSVPVYNEPFTICFPDAIDINALEKAMNEMIRRHESLRTRFVAVEGQPFQIIEPPLPFCLRVVDLRQSPIEQRVVEALQIATLEAKQSFDLASDLLLRATLIQLADNDYRLFLTMHHIVMDGISLFNVLLPELAALYEAILYNQPLPFADLSVQYADFSIWQRQWIQGEALTHHLDYWKQQLGGEVPTLQLPTDRPRLARQSFRGARQCLTLSKSLTEELKTLSQQEGVTLYMLLLAAFKTLLCRYTGQDKVVVGTVSAGRSKPEIENVIGFFLNTLVLRTDLSGLPSFRQLLARVREVTLDAYKHENLPFEQLVEVLQLERSLNHNPLFQVAFVLEPPMPSLSCGWTVSQLDIHTDTAKFDLTLELDERPEGIIGRFEYSTDLFDSATIARMIGHFQTLLEGIVADPDQSITELPLLTEPEQHQLLVEWNNTKTEYSQDKCIHQLFEEQVERTPDAIAIVFEDQRLTYKELNAKANQLAHYLQTLGVGSEVLVGICIERSLWMIIGILGILKAGGAYVPLDPAYPQERLAFMLEDAVVTVILTQSNLSEKLSVSRSRIVCLDKEEKIAQQPQKNLVSEAKAEDLAYIMYTSGSTGNPKGVCIPHRGVVRLVKETDYISFSSAEVFLQLAPISFDASTFEIWGSLLNGARLVLMPPHTPSLQELGQAIQQYKVTTLWLTASLFHLMVDHHLESLKQVRQLLAGGDVLSPCHVKRVIQELKSCRLINGYGPTENTTFTCCYSAMSAAQIGEAVPIGRPIANTQTYILDRHLQPVPVGVPGELHIGGDGLARGYLNRPDLTQEKFIPNPFSHETNSRLYKTGDLARYLPNGNIEFLGRIDHQVKIRGFRIELGEIEAELSQHPDVREAIVVVREDMLDDKRLVAYFVARQATISSYELRDFLKRRLPEYMLPTAFVLLDALPLTPNGKVDRRALPAPEFHPELELSFVAPRTPVEELLANIWYTVLKIEQIGTDDNFFELGGHSLLATQVISRVNDTWTVKLPLRSLFEDPTIAQFAKRIEAAMSCEQSIQSLPILPIFRSTHIPLSFAQQRLWFLDQLHSSSAFYNVPIALRFCGQLNITALETSLNEIVRRHEVLRTNFTPCEGQPVQIVSPTLNLSLQQIDLLHLAKDEQEAEAQRLVCQIAQQPFDLEREPLLRTALIKLSKTECIFVFLVHHIVFDAWSVGVFIRELKTLYTACCAGELQTLPELSIQYADFANWQRQWSQGAVKESQLSYWKKQLENSPVLLELLTDRPRPATQTFRGASQSFALSQGLSEALVSLSRESGTTLFMTLVAAFQALLYRYTGQDNLCIGTPIANRNHSQIEQLIGFFTNTLVLRTDLSGNPSFEQLLNRVREVALDAYAHQDLPFEELVEALQPTRSLSYTPLFQVMFVLTDASPWHLPDLTIHELTVDTKTAKFDLTLSMEKTTHGLTGAWEYNTDLFDAATIARMIGHFQTLLENIVAHPGQQISKLPLLTETEQHQLLVEWNNTKTDYPQDKCIHQLFEEQAERTPNAIAVVFEDQQLTYRELNARANQLAHYLQTLGVGPEVLVGICVERSLNMLVGLLGILKAGGAYVPFDSTSPFERLVFMLEDSFVSVLLTQTSLVEKLPQHQANLVCLDADWKKIACHSESNSTTFVTPSSLAYVIYTSGSTGKPKGVLVNHSNVVRLFTATREWFNFDEQDVWTLFHSYAFDFSVWEIWGALVYGGRLIIVPHFVSRDPDLFLELLCQEKVTVLNQTPSAFHQLIKAKELKTTSSNLKLRLVIFGGEALDLQSLKPWFDRHADKLPQLINMYGITETTVHVTYRPLTIADLNTKASVIGRPIPDLQVYLLDNNLQPVPIGVRGEIYVGGAAVARGYLNRTELTASRFISNPFSNTREARLYKSGDSARYLPSGNLEYLGRIDHQVKIRGFRIELGEIEVALVQHPNLQQATVVVREDVLGDKRLVAYITSNLMPDRLPYQSDCILELDGNTLKLRTEDISNGGIGLVDAPAMAESTPVRLHLLLPGTDEAQWFNGTVAWSYPSSAGIQLHLTPPDQSLFDQSITYLLEIQGLWKTWQRTIAQSLRQFLKTKLPDYMVPSAFVLMQTLPLTPNGKIDRRALPAPDRAHNQQEDQFVAPRTPTEISVAAIWTQVLGLQQVGIHDNFFELGGHSLLAVQITSRIREAFAIDIPLSCLFESPTIAALSQAIASAQENHSLDQPKTLPAIVSAPKNEAMPLSFSQYEMWYAEQHHAGVCAGNSPLALRLTGSLCPAILEQSLNEIIRRHEVLRTTFPMVEGQPIQKISPTLTVPLQVIDLQNLPFASREPEAQRILSEVMNHRFDLTILPLVKTVVIRLSTEEHWLLILMHHIITDGWSYGVLLEELETLYSAFSAGKSSPLPELPFQYADFAIWQRNYFSEAALAAHLPYWHQHLANLPTSLDLLPTTESLQDNGSAPIHAVAFPEGLTSEIASFSQTHSVTPFTVLLTALNILLYKWSNQTDILVLGTMANRTTPDIERLLGCFISDLPLCAQLDPNQTGSSLLKQIKQIAIATLTHAVPPARIWEPFEDKIEVLRTANLVLVPATNWSSQTLKCDILPIASYREVWNEQCCPLELYVSYPEEKTQAIELFASYSTTTFTCQ